MEIFILKSLNKQYNFYRRHVAIKKQLEQHKKEEKKKRDKLKKKLQAKQQHNQNKPNNVVKKRDEKFKRKQSEEKNSNKSKLKHTEKPFNSDEEIDSAEADSVHEMPISSTVNPTEKSIEKLVKTAVPNGEKLAKKSVKFSNAKSDDPFLAREEVS